MTSAPRRRLDALPASQPLLPLSALGSGSRLRRGTDRSCASSHQRRNRCRKGWILRGQAGDARCQLEENIPTFQASDILNAFFLLLRTQHENRVDYVPRWLAVSMQKYPHGQLPFPNRYPPIPVLPSFADPRYSSRESPFSHPSRQLTLSMVQCAERTCTATAAGIGSTRSTSGGSTRAELRTRGYRLDFDLGGVCGQMYADYPGMQTRYPCTHPTALIGFVPNPRYRHRLDPLQASTSSGPPAVRGDSERRCNSSGEGKYVFHSPTAGLELRTRGKHGVLQMSADYRYVCGLSPSLDSSLIFTTDVGWIFTARAYTIQHAE
jgi:hypothetical protein